jgi:hypothetical protein
VLSIQRRPLLRLGDEPPDKCRDIVFRLAAISSTDFNFHLSQLSLQLDAVQLLEINKADLNIPRSFK